MQSCQFDIVNTCFSCWMHAQWFERAQRTFDNYSIFQSENLELPSTMHDWIFYWKQHTVCGHQWINTTFLFDLLSILRFFSNDLLALQCVSFSFIEFNYGRPFNGLKHNNKIQNKKRHTTISDIDHTVKQNRLTKKQCQKFFRLFTYTKSRSIFSVMNPKGLSWCSRRCRKKQIV